MVATTTQQKLDYLISQKVAEHQNIKWGEKGGVRNVVIIGGKTYQYNKKGSINKTLEKIISSLYIDMPKPLKEKTTKDDSKTYHVSVKADLDKLKNNSIQNVKIDLTKITIKKLATYIGQTSDDVKIFMKLLTAKRYYALNDRTINLLMKGQIDMSVVVGEELEPISVSDAEIEELLSVETEIELFVVDKNKTRNGGAFFPYLNNTKFDLDKYGVFKNVDKTNYHHNCLYLALEQGGLSDVKLQQLILTLKNRTIHICDLNKVCDTITIKIKLTTLRNDGTHGVENYGKEYTEACDLGLIKTIIL